MREKQKHYYACWNRCIKTPDGGHTWVGHSERIRGSRKAIIAYGKRIAQERGWRWLGINQFHGQEQIDESHP